MAKPTYVRRFNLFAATEARAAGTFTTNNRRRFINDLGFNLDLVGIHVNVAYFPAQNHPDDTQRSFRVQLNGGDMFSDAENEFFQWISYYGIVRTAAGETGYSATIVNEVIGNFKDAILTLEPFTGLVSGEESRTGSSLFVNTRANVELGVSSRVDIEHFNIIMYFQKA